MFEIIIVIVLCSKLGAKLREKGINPLGYQIAFFLLWYVVEIGTAVVYVIIATILTGKEPGLFGAVVSGLAGAAVFAGLVFFLIRFLPDVNLSRAENARQFGNDRVDPLPDPNSDNPYRAPYNQ